MSEVVSFQTPGWPKTAFWLGKLHQQKPVTEVAFGTGWWEFDERFKFYPGQFVVVTGKAGGGKSTLMLNILMKLAHEQGRRCCLFVPENEPNLVHKMRLIWNADPDRNEIGFQRFCNTQCLVLSAIHGDEHEARTLPWLLDRAGWAVANHQTNLIFVDPWNEIERMKPKDMALTDYIGSCIMDIKYFCRISGATVIVAAHPTKAVNENGGRIPGLYDIEGSANWYNKCDNGLIVSRDIERNKCQVISAKVREIGAGKLGQCWFDVDPDTGLFTPEYGATSL